MRFRLIEAQRAQHSVSQLCGVLGVTRAGFYAWKRRGPSARELRDRELCALIERIFKRSRETYGVPRVHAELVDEHGVRLSRKRVARLMRRLGIEGVSRRGKRPLTTEKADEAPAVSDLVRRRFQAPGPDRLWVAAITYVRPGRATSSSPACSTAGVAAASAGRCAMTSKQNSCSTRSAWLYPTSAKRGPHPPFGSWLAVHEPRLRQDALRRWRAAVDRPPRRCL
jgi:hypothetical protein